MGKISYNVMHFENTSEVKGLMFGSLTHSQSEVGKFPACGFLPLESRVHPARTACGVSSRELAVGWHGDDRCMTGTGHAVGARGQDKNELLHVA